jgi:hypothetical protein
MAVWAAATRTIDPKKMGIIDSVYQTPTGVPPLVKQSHLVGVADEDLSAPWDEANLGTPRAEVFHTKVLKNGSGPSANSRFSL